MSRPALVFTPIVLFSTMPAIAQQMSQDQIDAMIAKSKELTAIDHNGCLKPKEKDIITVCGASEENDRQRLFKDQRSSEQDPNGSAANLRAAECLPNTGCIVRMKGGVTIGFGSVPPPAIPLEEVYRGLPEPDMIILEGKETALPAPSAPQ
jgi:hypothetical protein